MKPGSGAQPRVIAARVLDAVLHRGRSLKSELAAALPQLPDIRDRALAEAICFAALRQRTRYAAALAQWIPAPLAKRDDALRALLYAGFAQLDPMKLPPHAALASTVDAARELGRAHQTGLVNALLRRAQREGLPPQDSSAAWPQWLLARLRRDWPQQAEALIAASAEPGPLWLRVNARRGSRDAYAARLRAEGIESFAVETLPDALRLDAPISVAALPGFADGDVSIQDGAAQYVADAWSPPCGARALDACAAPGGKSAHVLERDPTLQLTALDADARRLDKARDTLQRLGLDARADLQVADVRDIDRWWDGVPFAAVLLDAPCTATGIVRRQPDILLHRRERDLAALIVLQAELLDACWRAVAAGGALLYATCSILKSENETQIEAFLARTPDAEAEPLDIRFGYISGAGRQRFPSEDGMDGFFYARLRKRIAA
ncbi:MAG: 16S rRNA (cytosine(967)-C(5))-methyltransferase RsmB [Luteimonas sp.]